jgi:hypothetical protein
MDVLLELPVPLLHIMREIRIEQLEEQKRQMDQSQSGLNNPHQQGVIPTIPAEGLQELTDELI